MTRRVRTGQGARSVLAALVVVPALALSSCSFGGIGGGNSSSPSPTPATSASTTPVAASQFTNDGTFQSHISVPGAKNLDFVYTLYPTKSTPRTNEWYPLGRKYLSFTFQAYDLAQKVRAPFATKRLVYLDTIKVTSSTVTSNGGGTQHPYKLNATASQVTFDPQPVTTRYGMLITSPKGAFEIRNQAIAPTSLDTIGINLTFTAVVYVQKSVGSSVYVKHTVKQVVPITIFPSKTATVATKIPVDAN